MPRPSPLSTTLRQKLSSLASPVTSNFASSPATISQNASNLSNKLNKKRGVIAGWFGGSSGPSSPSTASYDPDTYAQDQYSATGKKRAADELEVQRAMNALIFNGGLDFETRPMVVVTAAALPDPSVINYDELLSRVLGYLDLYVEADYVVVFLAAGGRYSPGWSWIWKAYRSLNRKYRKNLKKLYIVHSTGFTKMLFSLAGAIISPKFYAKIDYISTLSELAKHVPLTQINIAPAVYSENYKYEREITLPPSQQAQQNSERIFGVSLDDLMGHDGERAGIPRPIRDAVMYLRAPRLNGTVPMDEQGLFRRSPSTTLFKQVQAAYDRGQVVDLSQIDDTHVAAVLIKKFFRLLPEPIFAEDVFHIIRKCPNPNGPDEDAVIQYIRERVIGELSGNKQVLLNVVFQLLHEVSTRSNVNLMDAYNLAIVFTPNLVPNENPLKAMQMSAVAPPPNFNSGFAKVEKGKGKDSNASSASSPPGGTTLGTVVRFCIEHYYEIFDEVRDVSEAIPEDAYQEALITRDLPATHVLSSNNNQPTALRPKPAIPPKSSKPAPTAASSPPANSSKPPIPPKPAYVPRNKEKKPPPSASMSLLARTLADNPPPVPSESTSLLEGGAYSVSRPGRRTTLEVPGQPGYEGYDDGHENDLKVDANRARSISYRSGAVTGGALTGSGWTASRNGNGLPRARSVISIEKNTPKSHDFISLTNGAGKSTRTGTNGGNVDIPSGTKSVTGTTRGSIRLGKGTVTSGGTIRKSSSAGVVGVGITASGFFTSPSTTASPTSTSPTTTFP